MTAEADPRTCSPYPFAHLMPGARQQLRNAYASLLRERVARNAPPVKIPPPQVIDTTGGASALILIEHGCMFCGLGTQSGSAAVVVRQGRENVARELWTPKRTGAQQPGEQIKAPRRSLDEALFLI